MTKPIPAAWVDAALAADVEWMRKARAVVFVSPSRDQVEAMLGAAAPLIVAAERERIRQLAIEHDAFYDAPCPDGVADCIHQDSPFADLIREENPDA